MNKPLKKGNSSDNKLEKKPLKYQENVGKQRDGKKTFHQSQSFPDIQLFRNDLTWPGGRVFGITVNIIDKSHTLP